MQRFSEIKIGYPSKEDTVDILQKRAQGIDYQTAQTIADMVDDMRKQIFKNKEPKDLGLKGPVDVAQSINRNSPISCRELVEDMIVNPITTYEDNIDKNNGRLYSQLMEICDNYF